MSKDKTLDELVKEGKRYVDLSVDEIKLKTTRAVSTALGQVLAYLLLFAIISLFLGLLAFALLQWLNVLVGAPWATLIVAGIVCILVGILWLCRENLFRDLFVKLFIDVFYDTNQDDDEEEE